MTRSTPVRASSLADWALSHGRSDFTTEELAEVLDVPADQVRRRLHAPTQRGEWASPARGLWLPVPLEYRTWGAPEGIEIIDRLASHLGVDYYVGWLSAASVYGAAHQAPQVFQVAVSRHVRDRHVGRTRFRFQTRSDVTAVPTRPRQTRSGAARVSTPAATALDVATDSLLAAGIDNAATVIVELDEMEGLTVADLISIADRWPRASVRRVGWILETFGERDDLEELRRFAVSGPASASRLDPVRDLVGPLDQSWNIRVNREVEPDL